MLKPRSLFIVIVVLLVILIGSVVGLFFSLMRTEPTKTEIVVTNPEISVSNTEATTPDVENAMEFSTYKDERWGYEVVYLSSYQQSMWNDGKSVGFDKPVLPGRSYTFLITVSKSQPATFAERYAKAKIFQEQVNNGSISGSGAIKRDLPYKEDVVILNNIPAEKIIERSAVSVDATPWITYLFQYNKEYFEVSLLGNVDHEKGPNPDPMVVEEFEEFVNSINGFSGK